ncbi:hypothetical protein [Sphingobacterium prati]|uniref:hypothetical protein n=1 Tax=Sphingobacterium prati TaxID=2737006 RepID=UPI00155324FE|nr:hypothetical protein [Sphingobacterium prati]NPE45493.1 hypothetical protein [Sphingobacterium prati]
MSKNITELKSCRYGSAMFVAKPYRNGNSEEKPTCLTMGDNFTNDCRHYTSVGIVQEETFIGIYDLSIKLWLRDKLM